MRKVVRSEGETNSPPLFCVECKRSGVTAVAGRPASNGRSRTPTALIRDVVYNARNADLDAGGMHWSGRVVRPPSRRVQPADVADPIVAIVPRERPRPAPEAEPLLRVDSSLVLVPVHVTNADRRVRDRP